MNTLDNGTAMLAQWLGKGQVEAGKLHENPDIRAAYRKMAADFLDQVSEWPSGEGRGIVMCGGGLKYFPSLFVSIHHVRRSGCALPIHIWHLGPAEVDPHMKRMLAPLRVQWVDALENGFRPHGKNPGWQLKTWAILNCPFREVVFLDADCAPVHDPALVFDWPEYKETGAVLWPDFIEQQLEPHQFEAFGLPTPKLYKNDGRVWDGRARMRTAITEEEYSGYDLALETGQFVVDKSRCGRVLQLAHWYAETAAHWWEIVYGDKETIHAAFRVSKTPYYVCPWWPGFDGYTILHCDRFGKPMFEHRVLDKYSAFKSPDFGDGTSSTEMEMMNAALAVRMRREWAYRAMWQNLTPAPMEKTLATRTAGLYQYHGGALDLRPDGVVRDSSRHEAAKRHWSTWVDEKGPLLAIYTDSLEAILRPGAKPGEWSGRYLDGRPLSIWPAGKNGSNGVLMPISRLCVATIATPEIMDYAQYGIMSKSMYCARHGYAFCLETALLDKSRAPSWSKIPLVKRLLEQGNEWVFWSDADAIITDYSLRLDGFASTEADFYLTREDDLSDGYPLNMGHFLIRNCPWSFELLDAIWNDGPNRDPVGLWEQSSLAYLLFSVGGKWAERIKVLPQRAFNSHAGHWQPGDFILHAHKQELAHERVKVLREHFEKTRSGNA